MLLASTLPILWAQAAPVFANAPAPPPRREEATRLVAPLVIKRGALRGEERTVQAKIQIPAALVHGAAAGAPGAAGAAPPTGNVPRAPAPEKQSGGPALGTIMAGIALSLAAVSAVFLVRGKRVTRAAAAVSLVGAALLCAWSAAQADIRVEPPPPETQIVIELVPDGESVTLLLPR
jgi:hypothetical protein